MASDARMKSGDLESYRKILQKLQSRLRGDLDQMTDEALSRVGPEAGSGNLSNMPIHLADLGSENYDQEFTLSLIENEQETLEEVRSALRRIEAGTFGQCEGCGKPIAKARLQALPYTKLCIDCARLQESGANR